MAADRTPGLLQQPGDNYHAGAFLLADTDDKSVGVVIILEAADLDEARPVAGRDPYVTAGVFESLTVNPFKEVFHKQP